MSLTPILSSFVNMRASSILLKRSVVAEHVVSKFEYHWKYFLYVPFMIICSLLENYQRRHPFGTCFEPDHSFFKKFLYLLNATFRIRVGTTWLPDPLILGVINSINVEHFFVRKQKSQCLLYESLFVSNLQILIVLLFGLQKFLAEFLSCKILVLDHL